MSKPFKGYLRHLTKEVPDVDPALLQQEYGPTLGYIYVCQFIGHPRFGTTSIFARSHTSLVVKEKELPNGDLSIETLNSRYIVKKEDR